VDGAAGHTLARDQIAADGNQAFGFEASWRATQHWLAPIGSGAPLS
jgi:hypothetical protein